MKTKYFLYARKSTEDEERQVMSIEAQIVELNDFAERERLVIAETFVESKSAKKPGRPIFNEMMAKVYESREPVGILAWHPDRLARNSVDGGQIIYLIDIKRVADLKFPTFWFEPTPQGLFMLQVAFGQSKYYSDNLSQNVKRGLRQKIRRGEYPTKAPLGYMNDANIRNIVPHPTNARIVKKLFKEYATGRHSLETARHLLFEWGIGSRSGIPYGKAALNHILRNEAYIGLIGLNGEVFEGKYKPIIGRKLFEEVQRVLVEQGRPRNRKNSHNFPLTGLLRCGECGGAITAQYAKKRKYIYYRCSKRMGYCSQAYTSNNMLVEQLRALVYKVALSDELTEILLAELEREKREDEVSRRSFSQNLKKQLSENETKMDKLVNSFLDGDIERPTYLKKKDQILRDRVELNEQKASFEKKGALWFELTRDFLETTREATSVLESENLVALRAFVKKIGSNRLLLDKNVLLDIVPPFDIILNYKCLAQGAGSRNKKDNSPKRQVVQLSRDDRI
ncbi:MAG: recombinase family protein [Roseivirga sp.]|nr:recombinase family protein [Roseivirga sp.]